uniref:Uncharacterized protein n=1 Tax=Glossina brevipalpis TaxID=37001 RepID=A0A1A9WNC9_9MUSC
MYSCQRSCIEKAYILSIYNIAVNLVEDLKKYKSDKHGSAKQSSEAAAPRYYPSTRTLIQHYPSPSLYYAPPPPPPPPSPNNYQPTIQNRPSPSVYYMPLPAPSPNNYRPLNQLYPSSSLYYVPPIAPPLNNYRPKHSNYTPLPAPPLIRYYPPSNLYYVPLPALPLNEYRPPPLYYAPPTISLPGQHYAPSYCIICRVDLKPARTERKSLESRLPNEQAPHEGPTSETTPHQPLSQMPCCQEPSQGTAVALSPSESPTESAMPPTESESVFRKQTLEPAAEPEIVQRLSELTITQNSPSELPPESETDQSTSSESSAELTTNQSSMSTSTLHKRTSSKPPPLSETTLERILGARESLEQATGSGILQTLPELTTTQNSLSELSQELETDKLTSSESSVELTANQLSPPTSDSESSSVKEPSSEPLEHQKVSSEPAPKLAILQPLPSLFPQESIIRETPLLEPLQKSLKRESRSLELLTESIQAPVKHQSIPSESFAESSSKVASETEVYQSLPLIPGSEPQSVLPQAMLPESESFSESATFHPETTTLRPSSRQSQQALPKQSKITNKKNFDETIQNLFAFG